jgi:hypothetical protein
MSALARERCCRPDELKNKSLVEKMIEIEDGYSEINKKPIKWVEKLKCLAIVPGRDKHLCEIRVPDKDSNSLRNYVAVSYSCEPMEGECDDLGGYTILTEDRPERKNKVRNIVINRARRFAEHVGSSHFWIDQECVNQRSKIDKQMARMLWIVFTTEVGILLDYFGRNSTTNHICLLYGCYFMDI